VTSHVSSSSNHSSFNTNISPLPQVMNKYWKNMDEDDMAIICCMAIACDSHNFFTSHEIEEGARQSMDARDGVRDILTTM
jgi:hypothetical protein